MMINCPQCNLLQPKDQYCAGCGINMETWKPPRKPFMRKLLSNWMVQLGLLLVIVITLVLRDSFFKEDSKNFPTTVSSPIVEGSTDDFENQESPSEESQVETSRMESFQKSAPQQQIKKETPTESSTKTVAAKPILKKNVTAKIYLTPKAQLDGLLSRGQKIDDGVGFIQKATFTQFTEIEKQSWQQTDSIRKNFEFNKPILMFLGERIREVDQNIGFYFEVTVFETADLNNISFEIKLWNELKINGKLDEPVTYEFVLPQQSLAIIGGIAPRDLSFTEEERALFESSSSLQVLNNESFIEDFSDILLVLELN